MQLSEFYPEYRRNGIVLIGRPTYLKSCTTEDGCWELLAGVEYEGRIETSNNDEIEKFLDLAQKLHESQPYNIPKIKLPYFDCELLVTDVQIDHHGMGHQTLTATVIHLGKPNENWWFAYGSPIVGRRRCGGFYGNV